jgi:holo-ACP synthase/triphosphoribosyl-dephospho-CoA synthase
MAVQSLLCELYATPKPGLVDQNNSGSHHDMDFFTFLRSAAALEDYFCRCACIGLEGGRPGEIFAKLRAAGLEAEQRMYRATGGINTHKGAVCSLGILCGAAATLLPEQWCDPHQVGDRCASLARGLVRRDFEFMEHPATAGEQLFEKHGITGARGQAESGFAVAWQTGLPILEQGLAEGRSFNSCLCAALLHILVSTQDTNLIKRSNLAVLGQIQGAVSAMLSVQPYPEKPILEALDQTFIRRNLSPGGSADLLAVTCFFYFLKQSGNGGKMPEES